MPDANLKAAQQRSEFGRIVELYVLDMTALGGPVFRFTSSATETAAIVFDGDTYVPINVDADGFEKSSDAGFPTPTLRVSNVEFATQAAIQGYADLIGGKITRIRTLERHLDGGADPDPTARFPDDVFFVDRKTAQNKIFVEWELRAAADHTDLLLPGRQILRDSCSHIYRLWVSGTTFDYTNATCPYTGVGYFDIQNNPVAAEFDRCGKRLSSCKTRFGVNGVLPTRAFPGVQRLSG